MNPLNIAIAAEFELCEKIAEFLQAAELEVGQLAIVEIYPFNEEQGVRFNNRSVAQVKPEEVNWADFQYLFFAGDSAQAALIANAAEAGCVVLDLKGVCAAIAGVPVVVPSVNDQDLALVQQRNIVSLPEMQVTQLALTLSQIMAQYPLNQVFVTSLLPASYGGSESVGKLAGQTARLLNGIPLEENEQRLAFDVFPQSTQYLALQAQKIFPSLNLLFHAVQVPVFYGMAQKITALSDFAMELEPWLASWQQNDLLQLEQELLTPVKNGEQESQEESVKLHISGLTAVENGIEFWTVADEQRFNLAYLGVELLKRIQLQY